MKYLLYIIAMAILYGVIKISDVVLLGLIFVILLVTNPPNYWEDNKKRD